MMFQRLDDGLPDTTEVRRGGRVELPLDFLGGESVDDPVTFGGASGEEGPQLRIGSHEGGSAVTSETATNAAARDESSEGRKEGLGRIVRDHFEVYGPGSKADEDRYEGLVRAMSTPLVVRS